MKQFILHITSLATLSVLIIIMSVGVAILPECCRMAGEKLTAQTEHHDCHYHHSNGDANHADEQSHDADEMPARHCKVIIEKKDLMQHTPQNIVGVPVCITLPYIIQLPAPRSIQMQHAVDGKRVQPHSPPDKVGRMKFFSTFII